MDRADSCKEVWALYKEVASYYDAGLNPPEDITLLFPDDNSGNVYRLPTGEETTRKGGTGVSLSLASALRKQSGGVGG